MRKYTVEILNHRKGGAEILEYIVLECTRMTKRDYSNILMGLTYWASDSYLYKYLTARVCCEGKEVYTIKCDTNVDGSNIRSDILVARPGEKFFRVRTVTIAA